jgi:hypothetical protein
MRFLLAVAFIFSLSVNTAQALFSCDNIDDIAKEAVSLDLAGGLTSYPRTGCLEKMKFKYFLIDTEPGSPEKVTGKPKPFLRFDPSKDTYKIEKITKQNELYSIDVTFKISGKDLKAVYVYEPWDFMQKNSKGCGLVYSKSAEIYRTDCVKLE